MWPISMGGLWGGIFSAISKGAKYGPDNGKHRKGSQNAKGHQEKRRAAQKRARTARAANQRRHR